MAMTEASSIFGGSCIEIDSLTGLKNQKYDFIYIDGTVIIENDNISDVFCSLVDKTSIIVVPQCDAANIESCFPKNIWEFVEINGKHIVRKYIQ